MPVFFELTDKIKRALANSLQTYKVPEIFTQLRSDYDCLTAVSTVFFNDFAHYKIGGKSYCHTYAICQ